MKRLLFAALIIALVGLAGCAKQEEPVPADEAQAAPEQTEPISTEDFESGEAEGAVQGDDAAVDESGEDADASTEVSGGETP